MTLFKKIITIFMAAALLIAAFSSFCYADNFADVSIGGKLTIEGSSYQNDEQCFSLISINDAPMPEGSAEGVKETTVKYGEDFSFGRIYYERPGIYQYMVSRDTIQNDDVLKDESVYKVTVEIFSDGTDTVIYQREGAEGKPEGIHYIDKYQPPVPGSGTPGHSSPVKTGDTLHLNKYILLFASALVILVLCRFFCTQIKPIERTPPLEHII